jgi:hypothetical protein
MACAQVIYWGARLLTLIVFGATLTGCATFSNSDLYWGSRFGFRPDDPSFTVQPDDPCDALRKYITYAVNLKEAYRTRATQNRTWIYVAAIAGLGVAAASGALAAASAVAAGTLALLAISGGVTASTFATLDNSELANVYTVAANDIGTALGNAEARIARCPSKEECSAELAYLTNAVTTARNTLETARTASAAGALARATAQKTLLDQEIAKVQAQVDAQAKAKEAADKKEAAAKARAEANTAAKDAKNAPSDKDAADKARESSQNAAAKEREPDEAAAKLQAASEAKAAAMAPTTPPCLASPGKVVLIGKIVAIKPDGNVTVMNGMASFLDAVVENVDLRNVSNESLFIEIGGVKAPVADKVQKSLDEPYSWSVRFVPPAKRPKDTDSEYAPSLIYKNETLASAPAAKVRYP